MASPSRRTHLWAVRLQHILTDFGGNLTKIDPNDRHDAEHWSASSYADEFVTNDKKLLHLLGKIPGPKTRVMTLDEWFLERFKLDSR